MNISIDTLLTILWICIGTGVLITAVNLVILGFSLKLYTELMKDKNMSNRMKKEPPNA